MIDKSVSQMNIKSGRHRYAGDPVNLRLRLVFTDAALITEKPFAPHHPKSHHTGGRTDATYKYQEQCRANKQDDLLHHDERHQACYVLARRDDNNEWSITEESNLTGWARNSIKDTPTSSCKDNNPRVCLATAMKHRGLKLRVMSVPIASRMNCRCNRRQRRQQQESNELTKATIESATDLEHEHSNRDDDLTSERRNTQPSGTQPVIAEQARMKSENTYPQIREIESLFLERRRASSWKDTYNVTSGDDCEDYLRRTQARKLTTTLDDSHDQRLINVCRQNRITRLQLMRNHYRPPYEPCQCSRIPSVSGNNAIGNHSASSLCACPCLSASSFSSPTNASTRSDNKDNPRRREDDLKIPIDYNRSSHMPLANCGTREEIHYCRCGEFSEGYKRFLKLLNRFDDRDDSVVSDLFGPLASSLHELGRERTLSSELEREPAKFDDNDGEDKAKLCHDISGALFDENELCQETGASNNDKDRLRTGAKPQHKNESSRQNDFKSSSSYGNEDDIAPLSSIFLAPINSAAHELSRYQTGCHCADGHGETLLVTMEKQTLENEPLGPVNASVHGSDLINFRTHPNAGDYNRSLDNTRERETDESNSNSPRKSESSFLVERTDQRASECRLETARALNPDESASYTESLDKSIGAAGDEITRSASSNKANPCNLREDFGPSQQQRLETEDNNGSISNSNPDTAPRGVIDNRERDRLRQSQSGFLLDAQKLPNAQERQGSFMQNNFHNRVVEDSLLLAVIVIDVINGTVLITPDINELVEINLTALGVSRDAGDRSARDHSTNISQSLMLRPSTSEINKNLLEPLLFHVESISQDTDQSVIRDKSLEILRSEFGLTRNLNLRESKLSVHPSGPGRRKIAGYPRPLSGSALLKLQFTLHYAYNFSQNCQRVYVKYKLLARKHGKWLIQPQRETISTEDEARGTYARTEVVTRTPYKYGLAPIVLSDDRVDDKAKLEHMTLDKRELLLESSASITNDARATANKTFDRKCGDHEIVRPLTTASCTEDCLGTGDEDDGFLILLEGSTTTCRSNSRGHYNFCSVEQLTLKLSKKSSSTTCARTPKRHDDSNFSARSGYNLAQPYDDGTATTGQDGKMSNKIEEQRISKPSDENQMQTPEESLNTPMVDKMLVSQSTNCSQITTEALSAAMTNQTESFTHLDPHGELGEREDLQARSIVMDDSEIDPNLRTCTKCMGNICSCESSNLCDDERRQNNEKPETDRYQSNLSQQSDVACEISLVFKIYSTDFYHDKLVGWSSMRIPINLDGKCSRACKKDYPNSQFEPRTKNQQLFGSRDKCKCTHECHRCELPVMRPALCAPMDRLRYYLIGEMPKWTPSVESFVHSNNRYMLQTQECGKLVLDFGSSYHSR